MRTHIIVNITHSICIINIILHTYNSDNNHVHRFTIIAIVMLKNLLHPTGQIHGQAQH